MLIACPYVSISSLEAEFESDLRCCQSMGIQNQSHAGFIVRIKAADRLRLQVGQQQDPNAVSYRTGNVA